MLTINTDKQGNYLMAKARWVLRGFHDKQKDDQQTDSSASTRPGLRISGQKATRKGWDLFHIDLKTAFPQEQSYGVNRDVVCQLPPEASQPHQIAAKLSKPAYGMNDAPRRWWNILDKALRSYCMVPTRADRYCNLLYPTQSRERAWEHWGQRTIEQQYGTEDVLTELRERSEMDAAFEKKKKLDPRAGGPARGKSVEGIINPFVDDLFGTGGTEIKQLFLTRLRKILPSWFRRLE